MPLKPETLEALLTTEADLIKSLTKDVREIFIDMVGLDDLMYIPMQIDLQTHFKDCLTAMVGMAGTYNGLVSVHIPSPLAITLSSMMHGKVVTEINDDVNDAMGEVANMICGSFKQHLSKGGSDIRISTPSVLNGSEYMVTSVGNSENITLLFAVEEEWIMTSFSIENRISQA